MAGWARAEETTCAGWAKPAATSEAAPGWIQAAASNAAWAANPAGWTDTASWERAESLGSDKLHPEVAEICDKYHIDETLMWKLQEVMEFRTFIGSFEADMKRLWTDLEGCRNPPALLVHAIRQMKAGTFIGHMAGPDEEIKHLTMKFELDKEATKKLTEYITKHPAEKRQSYYKELELHLDSCSNPSKYVMLLLRKIRYGDALGPVEPKGGKGKGDGKGGKGDEKGGKSGSDGKSGKDSSGRRDDRGDRDDRDHGRDRESDRHRRSDRSDDRDRRDRDDRSRDRKPEHYIDGYLVRDRERDDRGRDRDRRQDGRDRGKWSTVYDAEGDGRDRHRSERERSRDREDREAPRSSDRDR